MSPDIRGVVIALVIVASMFAGGSSFTTFSSNVPRVSVPMRFSQTIKRFLSFAEVPWPLRIVRGVLALYLVFGLAAAIAWLGFGRNAEQQVVYAAESLTDVVLIFLGPLFLFGLIAVPFHRWIERKFVRSISAQERDSPKD